MRTDLCALSDGFAGPLWQHDLLAACTRVDPAELPADDESFWLAFAVRVVEPPGGSAHEPPMTRPTPTGTHSAPPIGSAQARNSFGAGPVHPADAESLADYAAESVYARELRAHEVTAERSHARFRPADVLWRALGAIDSEAAAH